MKVEFIRFKATDEVELQGWLSIQPGDSAVIHIHGRAGNGYENNFLDNLRDLYTENGFSFFSIDTRGRGVYTDFRQGDGWKKAGSCFEIFDESLHDIQGAINYLKGLGKTNFTLQGHSLGCTKIVNYVLTQDSSAINKIILLAPTDMSGWAKAQEKHEEYFAIAKKLLTEGKGEELVGAEVWADKTPVSAQTYPSICEVGSNADIYGDREGGALMGKVQLPMLIAYGDDDIGINMIDGTIDKWLVRVNKIKNTNTEISIIKGSTHGFRNYEKELSVVVETFIKKTKSMELILNPNIEIKDSPIQGKGIFTKVPIKKGEAVWVSKGEEPYDEKIYTDEEFKVFQKWCIENGKEWDAVANGDGTHTAAISDREKHPGDYGNHSCDPNMSKDRVALRDIEAGEELTADYAQFSTKDWEMKCNCGAKNCTGTVRGKL